MHTYAKQGCYIGWNRKEQPNPEGLRYGIKYKIRSVDYNRSRVDVGGISVHIQNIRDWAFYSPAQGQRDELFQVGNFAQKVKGMARYPKSEIIWISEDRQKFQISTSDRNHSKTTDWSFSAAVPKFDPRNSSMDDKIQMLVESDNSSKMLYDWVINWGIPFEDFEILCEITI